jgi:hypothetical protein
MMASERFDPGMDPKDIPPAKPIYGDNGRSEDQRPLELYDSIEGKIESYLQKKTCGNPNNFGCPTSDVAEALGQSYVHTYKAASDSEQVEVIEPPSRGNGSKLRLRGGV